MRLTWLNGGVNALLRDLLNKDLPQDLWLQAWMNDRQPLITDTQAAYTICTLPGYADIRLSPSGWTGSAVGGVATYLYPASTFVFAAGGPGGTVYGLLVGVGPGTAYAAGRLDSPLVVGSGGRVLTVTPSLALKLCPS